MIHPHPLESRPENPKNHLFREYWMSRYAPDAASTLLYLHRQHPTHRPDHPPRSEPWDPRGTVRRQRTRTFVVSKSRHPTESFTHLNIVFGFVIWIPFVSSKISDVTISADEVVKHCRKQLEEFRVMFGEPHTKRFRFFNDNLMRMNYARYVFLPILGDIP